MSTSTSLHGKLALITGCTGGIGLASARLLAQQGCSIAVHHSSQASKDKADETVAELTKLEGVRAAAFRADLSSYDQAKVLYDQVVAKLGNPDILLGNHGATFKTIGPTGDIQDISFEMFEETWRLNTGTNYYVINTAFYSGAVTGGVIGPHYASSKSALHGLIHWLSLRYAKDGIAKIPIGRLGKPDEIASIVLMLVQNGYMTNKVCTNDRKHI
ncbi:hypothetical protein PHLGIDRAFT_25521 [Phlebiopsis gigantea 11061_1 CR5-6]|uniref:Ketoreductase (KR) domain-containing protein n=1 Tax=Phlebiopsis gigantea (strain 11061_1 CR5-6) TaxID=745531 RepID=A0A0C3S3R9_PHLG1|nr:hypothetical protein PHLGIDRAFT_25521 [Phlebiopsis gigantea 11061_1 CR5-6]